MASDTIDRIMAAENLPTPPTVAVELLKLASKEDVGVADVATAIQKDPSSTARLLKVANSSLFGSRTRIASVRQAAVTLGLRAVRVLALSFSLVDRFRRHAMGDAALTEYWRRSLTTAVMAKLLANASGSVQRDEAFAGGLLCDIGVLAGWQCAREEYEAVLAECRVGDKKVRIQDVERRLLGTTHAEISAALLKRWNLPDTVCNAVARHHTVEVPGTGSSREEGLARVLWASATVADLFCGDIPANRLEPVTTEIASAMGITVDCHEEIMRTLQPHLSETANMLSLKIGESVPYDSLRERALSEITKISLATEVERAETAQRADTFERKASEDHLTGLPNRSAFDHHIAQINEGHQEAGQALSIIVIDLDHFKAINDTWGHQAGDVVLGAIGELLGSMTQEPSFVARYGGEEFAAVVPESAPSQAREFAESIRAAIEDLDVPYNGKSLRITASLGMAYSDLVMSAAAAEALVGLADRRLYEAKRKGRNRVEATQ